jgi:hypothetical protein
MYLQPAGIRVVTEGIVTFLDSTSGAWRVDSCHVVVVLHGVPTHLAVVPAPA